MAEQRPTATLKRLLPDTETEFFRNWDDTGNPVQAVSISLCNTSGSAVDVFMSFVELSGLFITGSIFSGLSVPANETIYQLIPTRYMSVDEALRGYASVSDVIAMSVDFDGVEQSLIPPEYLP